MTRKSREGDKTPKLSAAQIEFVQALRRFEAAVEEEQRTGCSAPDAHPPALSVEIDLDERLGEVTRRPEPS